MSVDSGHARSECKLWMERKHISVSSQCLQGKSSVLFCLLWAWCSFLFILGASREETHINGLFKGHSALYAQPNLVVHEMHQDFLAQFSAKAFLIAFLSFSLCVVLFRLQSFYQFAIIVLERKSQSIINARAIRRNFAIVFSAGRKTLAQIWNLMGI